MDFGRRRATHACSSSAEGVEGSRGEVVGPLGIAVCVSVGKLSTCEIVDVSSPGVRVDAARKSCRENVEPRCTAVRATEGSMFG